MTCKEKLIKDHPNWDEELIRKTLEDQCPDTYGYLGEPENCTPERVSVCNKCWDREIPEKATDDIPGCLVVGVPKPSSTTVEKATETPTIKDSGNRTQFGTGAVRDMREGKGRCDLMPLEVVAKLMNEDICKPDLIVGSIALFKNSDDQNTVHLYNALLYFSQIRYCDYADMFLDVAKHFEEGAKKYGENNWQKGIPVHCYIDSAVRHYLKWKRGDKDEPHDRAFVWNIMCCIWEVDFREKD